VRLRREAFKNPSYPIDEVEAIKGVTKVEHNPRTGSILIFYDEKVLDTMEAAKMLGKLDPDAFQTFLQYLENAEKTADVKCQSELDPWGDTISLTFALLSLVVSGFAGSKKIHILIGLFFLEMVVEHLWHNRKNAYKKYRRRRSKLGDFLRLFPFGGGPKTPQGPMPPVLPA
jgi:hypothetical protein